MSGSSRQRGGGGSRALPFDGRQPDRAGRDRSASGFSGALLICLVAVLAGLVFGGGTANIQTSDVFAEAICLPILVVAAMGLAGRAMPVHFKVGIAIVGLFALMPLLQLLPLPPDVWIRLPGRETIAAGYRLAGLSPPWLPISLSPSATRQSLLSLLPFATLFLATAQLSLQERRFLTTFLIVFALLSVVTGGIQVAQGAESPLRFYFWDNNEMDGFFANRNHFAALMYVVALLAASRVISVLATRASKRADSGGGNPFETIFAILLALCLAAVILGAVFAESRAGFLLCGASVALAALINLFGSSSGGSSRGVYFTIALAAAVFLIGFNQLFFEYVLHFGEGLADTSRARLITSTKALIYEYFPYGSGFGTFMPVFQSHETLDGSLGPAVNRAHNDFLEWVLEGGVASLAAMLAAGAWLCWMNLRAWMRPAAGATPCDLVLARAYAIAPVLLLLHSAVDYPLRTIALMTVAGVCAGMCIEPRSFSAPETESRATPAH